VRPSSLVEDDEFVELSSGEETGRMDASSTAMLSDVMFEGPRDALEEGEATLR